MVLSRRCQKWGRHLERLDREIGGDIAREHMFRSVREYEQRDREKYRRKLRTPAQ